VSDKKPRHAGTIIHGRILCITALAVVALSLQERTWRSLLSLRDPAALRDGRATRGVGFIRGVGGLSVSGRHPADGHRGLVRDNQGWENGPRNLPVDHRHPGIVRQLRSPSVGERIASEFSIADRRRHAYNLDMSKRRTRIEDGIDDIGLGTLLALLSLLFGLPAVAALSSEIQRSGVLRFGEAIVFAGVTFLVLASIRFLARGLAEMIRR